MEYAVEKMNGFKLVGFLKEISFNSSYQEIPEFWNSFAQTYMLPLSTKTEPKNNIEEVIYRCRVGEFGVSICDLGNETSFRYLIGGVFTKETMSSKDIPDGMTVYEFPDLLWLKFSCRGPLPEALQSLNTGIFSDWLPKNTKYEMAIGANIEWYSQGDMSDPDYESGIWIPVKEK